MGRHKCRSRHPSPNTKAARQTFSRPSTRAELASSRAPPCPKGATQSLHPRQSKSALAGQTIPPSRRSPSTTCSTAASGDSCRPCTRAARTNWTLPSVRRAASRTGPCPNSKAGKANWWCRSPCPHVRRVRKDTAASTRLDHSFPTTGAAARTRSPRSYCDRDARSRRANRSPRRPTARTGTNRATVSVRRGRPCSTCASRTPRGTCRHPRSSTETASCRPYVGSCRKSASRACRRHGRKAGTHAASSVRLHP